MGECRPLLTGVGLNYVGLRLLSDTFLPAMRSALADNLGGFSAMLFFTIAICSTAVVVTERCFALIHWGPDRVLRWLGAGESLDEASTSHRALAIGLAGANQGTHTLAQIPHSGMRLSRARTELDQEIAAKQRGGGVAPPGTSGVDADPRSSQMAQSLRQMADQIDGQQGSVPPAGKAGVEPDRIS